jgi:hypothetical protein
MQAMEGFPMTVTSLLLLSSLLAAPLAATDTAQTALAANQAVQIATANVFAAQTAGDRRFLTQLVPQQSADFAGESNGICYKIRAYIFKRNDDRAPEFTGSTTCGPRQPHAKNVVWPKARLVPAD